MLPDGSYAVLFGTGHYRLLRVLTNDDKKHALFGKRILFFKRDSDGNRARSHKAGWRSFAFLADDDTVKFHHKFAVTCNEQALESIRQAVRAIVDSPEKASALYKETENADRLPTENRTAEVR